MADGDVEVVRDRRRDFGDEVVRIRVIRVPESETFPEGIKYAFHYGRKDGDDPLLRYDNHHGVHERHSGSELEESNFQEPRRCSDGSFANSPTTFHPDP